jgi:hypothetical protein
MKSAIGEGPSRPPRLRPERADLGVQVRELVGRSKPIIGAVKPMGRLRELHHSIELAANRGRPMASARLRRSEPNPRGLNVKLRSRAVIGKPKARVGPS